MEYSPSERAEIALARLKLLGARYELLRVIGLPAADEMKAREMKAHFDSVRRETIQSFQRRIRNTVDASKLDRLTREINEIVDDPDTIEAIDLITALDAAFRPSDDPESA